MSNEWSIPLVGRENELALIREHLLDWGTRRVIFIAGGGGIGKTRLLNEVTAHFSDLPHIRLKTPEIIDFDDDRFKFSGNIGFSLARQLDLVAFEPYFEASRDLHLAQEHWGDIDTSTVITRKALAVNRIFVENFNAVARQYRVMLRFDTTDALSANDTISIRYLFEMASNLDNSIILIAGRNADEIFDKIGKDLGDDAILIRLQPFVSSDSLAYLEHKQRAMRVSLDVEWVSKLLILAGGLPVLIDLAIEWAQIRRPLEYLESLSLADLQVLAQQAENGNGTAQERLNALRERFASEVVLPTANLRTQLDHLKLVLAKVFPLNIEGVMEMLDISRVDAERLLEQAGNSVTIKRLPDGRFKLHDEVQRLINEYVWKKIDPNQEWENRDSKRAVEYLTRESQAVLREIHRLKESGYKIIGTSRPTEVLATYAERREKEVEFWSLRVERLRRQLENDVIAGYVMFQEDYDLVRIEASGFNSRASLLSTIEPYTAFEQPKADIHGQQLAEVERLRVQKAVALECRYSGMYARAAKIYEKLLARIPQDSEEYLTVLNGQANLLVRSGELFDAQRLNEQALRLSQERGFLKWELESMIEIGWVHRLMGRLDLALQYYRDALRLAIQQDAEVRIAQLYGNIAYVHALQHQEHALSEIQSAIVMWLDMVRQREGLRFHLGQAYNVAGEVCLELARPEKALTYFELSWSIFDLEEAQHLSQEPQPLEWKSKSRSGRGFVYWQLAYNALSKGDHSIANDHLNAAQSDLEWATSHAALFDNPVILNRLGEVYFLMEKYQKTIEIWLQSMDEARQTGDAFTELHSLSDLARAAFYQKVERFPHWEDFEAHYKSDYRRRHRGFYYQVLHGLFYTYLGHLALQDGQFDDAKRLYESGLSILAQTGTYGGFNLAGQLDFIDSEVLPQISSPEVAQKLGLALQEVWSERVQDLTALAYFRKWTRQADKN